MDLKLEICVENIASAIAAEDGGADRIELCQALDVGGVTPSIGLIKKAKKLLKIPVYMLVRPRAGNFVYSPHEISLMEEDIRYGYQLGIDGFVTGALKSDGGIDREACSRLIDAANGLPVTFHRAFDMSVNSQLLEEIIDLGFKRILTSGRCSTAYEGMWSIKNLIDEARLRIIIMPGSGITPFNLQEIMEATGAVEFHSSGQCKDIVPVVNEAVVKGATFSPLTSSDVVKQLKNVLKTVSVNHIPDADLKIRFSTDVLDAFKLSLLLPESIVKLTNIELYKTIHCIISRFSSLLDNNRILETIKLKGEVS